jgi:hypothetical protein
LAFKERGSDERCELWQRHGGHCWIVHQGEGGEGGEVRETRRSVEGQCLTWGNEERGGCGRARVAARLAFSVGREGREGFRGVTGREPSLAAGDAPLREGGESARGNPAGGQPLHVCLTFRCFGEVTFVQACLGGGVTINRLVTQLPIPSSWCFVHDCASPFTEAIG